MIIDHAKALFKHNRANLRKMNVRERNSWLETQRQRQTDRQTDRHMKKDVGRGKLMSENSSFALPHKRGTVLVSKAVGFAAISLWLFKREFFFFSFSGSSFSVSASIDRLTVWRRRKCRFGFPPDNLTLTFIVSTFLTTVTKFRLGLRDDEKLFFLAEAPAPALQVMRVVVVVVVSDTKFNFTF